MSTTAAPFEQTPSGPRPASRATAHVILGGLPVIGMTCSPASRAALTAQIVRSLTVPSGRSSVPSRSVATSLTGGRPVRDPAPPSVFTTCPRIPDLAAGGGDHGRRKAALGT
jgi:hypothetical protein